MVQLISHDSYSKCLSLHGLNRVWQVKSLLKPLVRSKGFLAKKQAYTPCSFRLNALCWLNAKRPESQNSEDSPLFFSIGCRNKKFPLGRLLKNSKFKPLFEKTCVISHNFHPVVQPIFSFILLLPHFQLPSILSLSFSII